MFLKMRDIPGPLIEPDPMSKNYKPTAAEKKAAAEGEKLSLNHPTVDMCLYWDGPGFGLTDYLFVAVGKERSIRDMLTKSKYPAEVFEAPLDELMRALVSTLVVHANKRALEISSVKKSMLPHERKFVAVLDKYRASKGGLPKVISPGGCGGDWIAIVTAKTNPPGGSVKVMREFYYQLCKANSIRPYSDDCDKWDRVTPKTTFPAGMYRYRVKWGNDPEECSRMYFRRDNRDGPDEASVNVISKSGGGCN